MNQQSAAFDPVHDSRARLALAGGGEGGGNDYRARFSLAEFAMMCDAGVFDEMKVELIDGELERMNLPQMLHSSIQTQLMIGLAAAIAGRNDLMALGEVGIQLGDDTLVGCDALVAKRVTENRWLRAEEAVLVAEVSITTQERDLGMKRLAYARAGVAFYWVVDGEKRIVHRFAEPHDGDYRSVEQTAFGQTMSISGLGGTIVVG